ncbi:MAG: hypothetical protein AAGA85_13015 [Bacteroidota bacterium]
MGKLGALFLSLLAFSCNENRQHSEGSFSEGAEVKEVGEIVGGEKVGAWISLRGTDTVKIEYYRPGKELVYEVDFVKNRRISRRDYYLGKHVRSRFYFENGNISSESFYEEGEKHGLEKSFYEDGTEKTKANYVRGEPEGEFFQYYPSGQLQFYSSDIKNQTMTHYDSLGNLLKD